MSNENTKRPYEMPGLTPQRDRDIQRRIAETDVMIANTRRFLEQLAENDSRSKDYVESIRDNLENQLKQLNLKKKNESN